MMDDAWVLEEAVREDGSSIPFTSQEHRNLEAIKTAWEGRLAERFEGLEGEELRIARYGAVSAVVAWSEIAAAIASQHVENEGLDKQTAWPETLFALTGSMGILMPGVGVHLARQYIEAASHA